MNEQLAPIAVRAAAPAALPDLTAGGLTWRSARENDAASFAPLWNAIYEADDAPHRDSEDDIAEQLRAPWIDLAQDSRVGLDAEGVPRAVGLVSSPPGDERTVRAFLFGGVHPERRGKGIGRALLDWQIARARQLLAASGKELPARIGAFAEDSAAATRALYARAGLEPRRWYIDLRRPLGDGAPAVPEVELTGSLRLVPFSPELDEATRLAHNDAFRDHWGSEPQTREQWTQHRGHFMPEWSFLVVDDEPAALLEDAATDEATRASIASGAPLVVGYQLASRYEEDFAVRGYSFGYTDLLGTRRAYRGRKAALAALAAGMRAFEAAGLEAAVLDVDTDNPSGAHGLYASLGYVKTSGSFLATIEL